MFFNVDILYRNGPLALVWLAGSSENIMRNGPTKSKHKADIMKADLLRIIELIFQQLSAVGTDTGMSLKKIACLYHGVVVIHHMQLEATIKRLSQMYFESCKLRDFDEDCNEIDVAPIEHRDLVVRPKMQLSTSSRLQNATFMDETHSPRRLPQPEGVDESIFEETSFDTMMLNLSPRNRGHKRRNDNMDEERGHHTKLPRTVPAGEEFVTELEENVTACGNVNADEDRFEDWDMRLEGALLPPPPQINVDDHAEETIPANLNELQHQDEENIIISPENRNRTMECNQLPLRPLQAKQLHPERIRRKPRRLIFNEETMLDHTELCNQIRAALQSVDSSGTYYADMESKARLTHAIPKSQHLRTVKGLKFISNAGRNLIGARLNELHTSIIKNMNTSMSHSRLREKNTTTTSSAMDSEIPERSRGAVSFETFQDDVANNFQQLQPFVNEDVSPELMETEVGENGLENLNPNENEDDNHIPLLSPILRRLRNEQIDPPTHATTITVNRDNLVNETTIIERLETGDKVFSDIFPINSTTKQQAAAGLMLLLRMKNDRKIEMVQSANNGSYGVIYIRRIEH